jgi:hypothetical protein
MKNNHIVFGICLCHRLHPLEWWERIMALLGSVAVGLIATNIAYLWDVSQIGLSEQLVSVFNSGFVVTKGMVFLWTIGAILHSVYDLVVWNVMSCACCHPGGKWGDAPYAKKVKDCGSFIMIPVVLCLVGIATVAVMRRATGADATDQYNNGESAANPIWEDSMLWSEIDGAQSFSFLSKYAIELALTWFVWFPIVGTVVFSGVLGCGGRLPVLGGRPRDIKLYEESMMAKDGGYVRASC